MNKIETKQYIEFTKDGVVEKFHEGDKVVCKTKEGNEYKGTIVCVGDFKENDSAEAVAVICIDTSKSVWSSSREIIKFDDIDFIYKDFLADTEMYADMTDNEMQKNTYIHMLTGMGFDRNRIDNTWNIMNKLMKHFDISFEKAMGCMMYSLKYNCSVAVPLKYICGIDIESLNNSIPIYQRESMKCLGMALASGVCYLIADYLCKE